MLATPDNEEWKYMRKMTNPAFSPENIRKVGTQADHAFAMHIC
jgi:cytochrome P450